MRSVVRRDRDYRIELRKVEEWGGSFDKLVDKK